MAWINELHYDNSGTDAGEFIEVAGAAGEDLTGWSIVLYNGSNGAPYNTMTLSGAIADAGNGFGTLAVPYPSNGIQNGAPDAVALVDADGNVVTSGGVVQFLSYEGELTAVGGPADALTSTDIGVAETGSEGAGNSLQLTGAGNAYDDFTWTAPADDTPGAVNNAQTFAAETGPAILTIGDAEVVEGNSGTTTLAFTVSRSNSEGAFTVDFASADGSAEAGTDFETRSGTLTFEAGGALEQRVEIVVNGDAATEPDETFTVALSNVVATAGEAPTLAPDDAAATGTIGNDDFDEAEITEIYEIQGDDPVSALEGETVRTGGIVTAVDTNGARGFYLQAETGDGNHATSDAVFVFTGAAPGVSVGDRVSLSGTVEEFVPNGAAANALPITEITGVSDLVVLSSGNALPDAVRIGEAGRVPPTTTLEEGIAFFESLEGMRVTVEGAMAVSPSNGFGEIYAVVDGADGALNATNLSDRGTLVIAGGEPAFGDTNTQGGNFHPERIQIDDDNGVLADFTTPDADVGARLGDVTGVVGYNFGNYEVVATEAYAVETSSTLERETTSLVGTDSRVTVATYNAENLDPTDGPERFAEIADQILSNLQAPDILALQEVQDDDGAANSSTVSAGQTLGLLVETLNEMAAMNGSPATYAFADNPFIGDDTNGGEPGGNIRTAFIYREDRVALDETSLRTIAADGSPISAGTYADQQTNPENPFFDSRPPLVADFSFNGETVTVISNHLTSKGGSDALFGFDLPPENGSAVQRGAQAQAINNFVDGLLADDPQARIAVTGDLNDFQFEEALKVLSGEGEIANYTVPGGDPFEATADYRMTPDNVVLSNLTDTLPENERYSYNFEGNAQSLDHILVSGALGAGAAFDAVHINSEFADQASDHDPLVSSFELTGEGTGTPDEPILGTAGNDDLAGTEGDDVVRGREGNDRLSGEAGADLLAGGEGNDTIDGGEGDDRLRGGEGNDRLDGAEGDDELNGGAGNDRLDGGADDDRLAGAAGNDVLDGADGDDLLAGGDGNDDLDGGEGDDRVTGGAGNDRLDGGHGADIVAAGAGNDTLRGGEGDDRLGGGEGNDRLDGAEGDDELNGGAGNDRLDGGIGGDILAGGEGRDILVGGDGDDRLAGGAGDDRLQGGAGSDIFVFGADFGSDRVEGFDAGEDLIQFSPAAFADYDAVMASSRQVGRDVVIDQGDGSEIRLERIQLGTLEQDDFWFA